LEIGRVTTQAKNIAKISRRNKQQVWCIKMTETAINADKLKDMLAQVLANAQHDLDIKAFDKPIDTTMQALVIKPNDLTVKKTLKGFLTGTFLDKLYFNEQSEPLNGLPSCGQIGIVGLSGVGKSLLAQEILLRTANESKGVVFITSEDIFNSDNERFDLQSRLMEKSKSLGLDWQKIKDNLFVLDCITHGQLSDFETLIGVYRSLVEDPKNNIKLLVIDSLTLLESYRQNLKHRVLQLSRFNQLKGITGLYVCQRSEEETDKFSISGGVGVAHNLDSVICIDFAKAMGQMKDELQKKQWENTHFARILSCRLCSFNRKYIEMEITPNGFLKAINK
jgi:KaiC/GvpD/RAD55 family RecA-like ATPase